MNPNIARRLRLVESHLGVYRKPTLPQFSCHRGQVHERIYAGRNPLTVLDVESIAGRGVTHILDLREEKEWSAPWAGAEALEALNDYGIQRRHIRVTDMGAPSNEALDQACEFLSSVLENPLHRVYVHCRAGKERTAAVLLAFYCRTHGLGWEEGLGKITAICPEFVPLRCQVAAVQEWLRRR